MTTVYRANLNRLVVEKCQAADISERYVWIDVMLMSGSVEERRYDMRGVAHRFHRTAEEAHEDVVKEAKRRVGEAQAELRRSKDRLAECLANQESLVTEVFKDYGDETP